MATTNDVTGDPLITKAATKAYRDNYDRIFRSGKGMQHLQAPCTGEQSGRYTPSVLGVHERNEDDEYRSTILATD